MSAGDRAFLFTGYPGFIGQRLIPRLLELMPDAGIRCLVQQKFLEQAQHDVRALEQAHPSARGRLELLVGDITLPGLGMDASAAGRLKDEIVGAYHLAALYDLAVARGVAMRVNVEGTRHVVRFLEGARRLERLDYVSTAYVSGDRRGVFRETDLALGQRFNNHYEETKFLAEVDVAKSGLPCAIYRPGIVVGDSRTGATAKFDGPYYVLAAMEKTPSPGLFARVGSGAGRPNIVPVDFVIEALARLSCLPTSIGHTYHLTDPEPLDAATLSRLLADALGRRFTFVRMPRFVAAAALGLGPVQRYLGMPPSVLPYFDHGCLYDSSQASHDLAPLDVRCPPLVEYLDRLVAFYRSRRDDVRRTAMV